MRYWIKIVLVWSLLVVLTGCQYHAEPSPIDGLVEQTQVPAVVVIDQSMVFSHHIGKTAKNTTYLMLVLNDKGTDQLALAAHDGRPYRIHFAGHMFIQSAQISSGFLVLSPVPEEWGMTHIKQFLPQ